MSDNMDIDALTKRVAELERIVKQMGIPYVFDGGWLKPQPCLFDGIDPATNPVMGLACPCPRHSPR